MDKPDWKLYKLLTRYLFALIIALDIAAGTSKAVKVLDINEKLPELIDKHPEKGWLIKFYAPWCHHCQQLEPVYNNVAERVYSKYNDLIVGRVDCTKIGSLCGTYGVDSYPTIIYIDKDSQVKYRGDRSEDSLVAFAERLLGPTINVAHGCQELIRATDKHGLVILSTISNATDATRREFESLAREYKSTYWFYQYSGTCEGSLQREGLYVLKRHLAKPIKFELGELKLGPDGTGDLRTTIIGWLNKESFPVYGPISYRNIERALQTEKLLVVAVLDEYKPARRFSRTSREFYKQFEDLAKRYAGEDDQLLFAWSSDLELIQYITITPVNTPNVIILKPDFSYHLMLTNSSDANQDKSNEDKLDAEKLSKLSDSRIRYLVLRAREGNLAFSGGSNYLFAIVRYVMGTVNKFFAMYKANPLLVSLIFGFPSVIIIFVVYTTCFYDSPERDADEEDADHSDYGDDEEDEHLLSNGHLKQD